MRWVDEQRMSLKKGVKYLLRSMLSSTTALLLQSVIQDSAICLREPVRNAELGLYF